MKKLLLLLMFSIVLISVISAESIGTFKQGDAVTLPQLCATCTSNNITILLAPNGTTLIENQQMTKSGSWYNYTLDGTYTSSIGTYSVNGIGDLDGTNTVWAYTFTITNTGSQFDTGKSILYAVLIGLFILIFIGGTITVKHLPSSNTKDDEGRILSINKLKYLRPAIYFILWILFIAILFLAQNVAYAYLGESMFSNVLFVLFRICLGLSPLIMIVWVIHFFVKFFEDKKFQKMLNRGFYPKEGRRW